MHSTQLLPRLNIKQAITAECAHLLPLLIDHISLAERCLHPIVLLLFYTQGNLRWFGHRCVAPAQLQKSHSTVSQQASQFVLTTSLPMLFAWWRLLRRRATYIRFLHARLSVAFYLPCAISWVSNSGQAKQITQDQHPATPKHKTHRGGVDAGVVGLA